MAFIKSGSKGTVKFDDGVKVTAENVPPGTKIVAEELKFLGTLKKGRAVTKGAAAIYPIVNLDIYVKSAVGVTAIPPADGLKITVIIPGTATKIGAPMTALYFQDSPKGPWQNATNGHGSIIGTPVFSGGGVSFVLADWPLDDRMVGGG